MTSTVPPLTAINRLLIVKTSSLGDIIHALPVVQALKEARPELALGWVVRRRCAGILQGCPFIDHLHIVPDKPTLRELWTVRRALRARHYEAALDMQGLLLSGLLTWLSAAPVRIGWDRNREGNARFLTHPVVPGGDITRHEIDALYGFAEALGVHPARGTYPPQAYLASEGRAQAEAWLAPLPRPRIALNVGASRAYKTWPTGRWAALADGLAKGGAGLVFVGDATDAAAVDAVQTQMTMRDTPSVNLAGKTTLRELASVLEACDSVVSADTGPMHLAVAVGTPVVALFGGTDPRRHGPYGARHISLHKPQPGGVPSRRPTDAYGAACMAAISPADVLDAVRGLLYAHA